MPIKRLMIITDKLIIQVFNIVISLTNFIKMCKISYVKTKNRREFY